MLLLKPYCDHKKAQGFTLLELLVALVITAPLLILVSSLLFSTAQRFLQLANQVEGLYAALKLRAILQTTIDHYDSHTLPLAPRIHPIGKITYLDGSDHAVNFASEKVRPDPESSAISAITLNLDESLDVLAAEKSGSMTIYLACQRLPVKLDLEERWSFLGISLAGPLELDGKVEAASGKAGCLNLALAVSRSMSIHSPNLSDPLAIRLIIPIRSYTIYLSQAGELRYLAHQGDNNIENQPILSGLNSLQLSTLELQEFKNFIIQGEIKPIFGSKQSFSLASSVSRGDYINLLLNRF